MPTAFDAEVIGTNLQLAQARQVAEDVGALHLPVAFPEVFLRERSGFDCLLGNPPWDTVKIEEQKYFGVRFPGLRSMETGAMSQAIGAIKTSRLDVAAEYERRIRETERYRSALLKGPYPGLGTGDPDLSEVFAWRYWQLARDQGWIGVVLPRSILMSAGTDAWRLEVLRFGQIHGLVTLINTGGWVFDDAEPRYTIAFITMQRTAAPATSIKVFGPYRTLSAFQEGMRGQGAELVVEDIVEWTPGAALPLLPSEEAASVYRVMRAFPSWIANSQPWAARTYRELDSSLDRVEKGGVIDLGAIDTEGLWPVYKGESFRLWEPATGVVYGWADPDRAVEHLVEKRERQVRNRRSAFYGMSGAWASNPSTLPCMHPRIAWRKVARATDTRSFYAVLLPPRTLTADHNFLVFFPDGNAEREEAFLLGVFCSLPFDWHARLWVEANFTFNVVQPFPVPPATRDDALRRRIEEIAGRLAAVDERYEDWAAAVGVAIGGVADAEERVELVTELDALVARLYGLDEKEIRLVFETFHDGWDYTPRLEHVLTHFRELV